MYTIFEHREESETMLTTEYLRVPTMTVTRIWSYDSVRGCCITNDYYTNGSNKDYADMLDYVHDHDEPTEADIYAVALDIVLHSELENRYGCTTDGAIDAVLFELYNRAITTSVRFEL